MFQNFVYLFLAALDVHFGHGLSQVAASGGCSLLQFKGFSFLLLRSLGCRACTARQLQLSGSRARAELWCTDLVASQHVKPSQTGDRTRVPCIGKQTPFHWTTRKVFKYLSKQKFQIAAVWVRFCFFKYYFAIIFLVCKFIYFFMVNSQGSFSLCVSSFEFLTFLFLMEYS